MPKASKTLFVGPGGTQNRADAFEFLLAGATAVSMGKASFDEPQASFQVIADVRDSMEHNSVQDVRKIAGSARL